MVMRDGKQLVLIENSNPIRGYRLNWFEDVKRQSLGVNLRKTAVALPFSVPEPLPVPVVPLPPAPEPLPIPSPTPDPAPQPALVVPPPAVPEPLPAPLPEPVVANVSTRFCTRCGTRYAAAACPQCGATPFGNGAA
jgi:hypothetical protein